MKQILALATLVCALGALSACSDDTGGATDTGGTTHGDVTEDAGPATDGADEQPIDGRDLFEQSSCVPASEVGQRGVTWGDPCCPEDIGLEEVYQPDGCNWCTCVAAPAGSDLDPQWECTATICTHDVDAGTPGQDVTSPDPGPDTSAPPVCPPEGSEILADPPPETIPEGTCEPQPVPALPEITVDTVTGTEVPSEFVYHVPANPKGLLVIFHGGGGSKEDAYQRVEAGVLFQEAIAAGYAIAALDSVAHINPIEGEKKKWNELEDPCNPDIQNVVAMVTQLKDPEQLGLVPKNAPLYALGVSNGGSMVSRTSQHIDFAAVATYITNAQQFHDEGASIPPVFIVAGEQDSTVGTTGPCLLYGSALAQGIDAELKQSIKECTKVPRPGLRPRSPPAPPAPPPP
ncbi:MAG: hypothetical protein QF464_03910, partial [Myxococcota bacterium]|nr:hypothetical protein [Myxococcota bacterium]